MKKVSQELSEERLRQELLTEAKVVGVKKEVAELWVDKVVNKVMSWAKKRSQVTLSDLNARIAAEVKKYNQDVAYVYENRDKII